MSEEKSKSVSTREFLSERDLRIFKLRQAGTSTAEIARRFGVTTNVVSKAIQRQLQKMNSETLLAYPEVLRMELERLDNLQQAIWPMTQHRRQVLDDGSEIQIEPDLKAIQQVLGIMDRRSKLLGMDQANLNVQMDVRGATTEKLTATLSGAAIAELSADRFEPEGEARQLLQLMGASGVLPANIVEKLLENSESDILDAELIPPEGVNDENPDE